jgi:hypothetical protein
MRQPAFFRVARILRDEKKFGWRSLQGFGTVKSLFNDLKKIFDFLKACKAWQARLVLDKF